MKNKIQFKKLTLSVVCMFTIMFSILGGFPIFTNNVRAYTSRTQQEAVDWAKYQADTGAWLDHDGAYGVQCVDLIRYYYEYLGVGAVSGNGCDYAWNSLPSGWQRIQNTPDFVPQPGDIAVWNSNAGHGYGHVAIVISATGSQLYTVDQNWNQRNCHYVTHNYKNVWGFIRPDFGPSYTSPPTNTSAWMSNYMIAVGENVTFSAGGDNVEQFIFGIDREGVRIDTLNLGSNNTYTRSFDQAGSYTFYATCYNSLGYTDTGIVNFWVYDSVPKNPWCGAEKPCYAAGEEVKISMWADGATHYWLHLLDENNNEIAFSDVPRAQDYKTVINKPGKYSGWVTAVNNFGYADAPESQFSFEVYDGLPSDLTYTSDKNVYEIGEEATFTPQAFGATHFWLRVVDETGNTVRQGDIPKNEVYKTTFDEPGYYKTWVSAVNNYGYIDGDNGWFTFEVKNKDTKADYQKETANKRYLLFDNTEYSWASAKYVCEQLGGHLVTINDESEQQVVNELIRSGSKESYWIGLSDSKTEGDYQWVTGEKLDYTNWSEGQPDNYEDKEDAVLLFQNGQWNDGIGLDKRGFICEIDIAYKGDLNANGKVDLMDARKAKQAAMRQIKLSETELKAADLNGDGKVDVMEARKIKQAAMKQIEL